MGCRLCFVFVCLQNKEAVIGDHLCLLFVSLQIQRMVIAGGNFRPDVLKPKEVVSLLLDDDEMHRKCE